MADHAKTPKRAKRQKRERLSRETIAQTALELIDREGLDALSMRRVAAELAVDPMALYRSVRDRDDLIDAIVALLLHEMDGDGRATGRDVDRDDEADGAF